MSSETGRAKIIVKHDLFSVYITAKQSLHHPAFLKPRWDRSFQDSIAGRCAARDTRNRHSLGKDELENEGHNFKGNQRHFVRKKYFNNPYGYLN